jgi:hypothetical protein
MPKLTPDKLRYWSQTKLIGEQLRAYYRANTNEELPPKKLDEEVDPSAEQVEVIRDIES